MDSMDKLVREKEWGELADEEKIERLHQQVRALLFSCEFLERQARKMRNHQHSQDGQLLVPIDDDEYPDDFPFRDLPKRN